jgi:hypothetical protein
MEENAMKFMVSSSFFFFFYLFIYFFRYLCSKFARKVWEKVMHKVILTSHKPTSLLQFVCSGTLETDRVYFQIALLD